MGQAAHWRRNGFATWLFTPAASGWYPKKAPQAARPVPVLAEPWPGAPARGRGATGRADACWVPIAKGLTPHGLRHTHKTRMEGFRTPTKLMDERLGHMDGSAQARCTHITREMRADLLADLTAEWEASLDARLGMSTTSPVAVLDALLRERLRARSLEPVREGNSSLSDFPRVGPDPSTAPGSIRPIRRCLGTTALGARSGGSWGELRRRVLGQIPARAPGLSLSPRGSPLVLARLWHGFSRPGITDSCQECLRTAVAVSCRPVRPDDVGYVSRPAGRRPVAPFAQSDARTPRLYVGCGPR